MEISGDVPNEVELQEFLDPGKVSELLLRDACWVTCRYFGVLKGAFRKSFE